MAVNTNPQQLEEMARVDALRDITREEVARVLANLKKAQTQAAWSSVDSVCGSLFSHLERYQADRHLVNPVIVARELIGITDNFPAQAELICLLNAGMLEQASGRLQDMYSNMLNKVEDDSDSIDSELADCCQLVVGMLEQALGEARDLAENSNNEAQQGNHSPDSPTPSS